MKEQDLRRCFSKIKPSERLVNDTIRKIGEAEESPQARSRTDRTGIRLLRNSFSSHLARF